MKAKEIITHIKYFDLNTVLKSERLLKKVMKKNNLKSITSLYTKIGLGDSLFNFHAVTENRRDVFNTELASMFAEELAKKGIRYARPHGENLGLEIEEQNMREMIDENGIQVKRKLHYLTTI
ncbi:MAG: hypothetical protein R3331_05385 [Sulfurospirillaceae bacterium]|nr:hypothetical protein [Sulfurospirillaceae bacterium]